MKNLSLIILFAVISISTKAGESISGTSLISNLKQLTFEGTKSGEGYFSRDGKKMVFQSDRHDGNPFYQIYLLDLINGKTELISTGSGKTTCAWIHPLKKEVMYSSTHLDKNLEQKIKLENENKKTDKKSKYSWSYDENFDIFVSDFNGKVKKQLTTELGYDAEGSYSPDGKFIAFASNRNAYNGKMSDEDKKYFEQDQSYMMDIYIMNSDGTKLKQLTQAKGYDGGPFFSADGKKITWRRFTPNGQIAEIYTMNIDGTDQKPVTKLGGMSWAPFFHPSGDYIVFTTNIHGYSNFELYIVDSEGKRAPVRVTDLEGFDGLPAFSPDGNRLSWTRRNEKGESQIYIAQWNDLEARRLLKLSIAEPRLLTDKKEVDVENIKKLIYYFSSEQMSGRASGSKEEKIWIEFVQNEFQKLGLDASFGQNKNKRSFIQGFDFVSGIELGKNNSLKINFKGSINSLKPNDDFLPLGYSQVGEFSEGEVAFAGYGIVAPADDKNPVYDSYKDLDVKDKWVIILSGMPENGSPERRQHLSMYSRLQHKAMQARLAGARGLIVLTDKMQLRSEIGSQESIPILQLRKNAFSFTEIDKLEEKLNKFEVVSVAKLEGVQLSASVDIKKIISKGHNVVGILKGKNTKKTLVVGAHGDHLGLGQIGNSLAHSEEKNIPHYGADDNASGMAGVLELARYYSSQNKKPEYNIAFAVWSGEEIGLLGSTYFVKNPKNLSTPTEIISYINFDMIGRLREKLYVQGLGSAREWRAWIEEVSVQTDISISTQDDPYQPTDSMAFYLEKIPGVTFFTGAHTEYHSPRDQAQLINFDGTKKILNFSTAVISKVMGVDRPTYKQTEGQRKNLEGGRSFRIYLGTIPDYSQEGVKGVRISGVAKDSPAEKAGLKGKDILVELDGRKIDNLYDYVYILQSIKSNKETTLKALREGGVVELKIVPLTKE